MNHSNETVTAFKADEKGNIPKRYRTALGVAQRIITRYMNNSSWKTAAKDFYVSDIYIDYSHKITCYDGSEENGFRMEKIVDYAKEAGLGKVGMDYFRKVDINSYH